jgi:hypothetical protein
VHLLKSLQNNIFASRTFEDSRNKQVNKKLCYGKGFSPFGWDVLEKLWDREKGRMRIGSVPRTRITAESINLTSWSKMKVHLAKKVSSPDVIAELVVFALNENNIQVPEGLLDRPEDLEDRRFRQERGQTEPDIQFDRILELK